MPSECNAAPGLPPSLAGLQKEVRALTGHLHRRAMALVHGSGSSYLANVAAQIDLLIAQGDVQKQVVCFASAAEFGLPLLQHAERCRQAVAASGSEPIRALFWAASHRMRAILAGGRSERWHADPQEAPAMAPRKPAPCTSPCDACEALRADARCADGHSALRATSDIYFKGYGGGMVSEAQRYRCETCVSVWTRYRSPASPFSSWSIASGTRSCSLENPAPGVVDMPAHRHGSPGG